MTTDPRPEDALSAEEEVGSLSAAFDGALRHVTQARLAAEGFLGAMARASPPTSPDSWYDVLLVVNELAANAVQYAPGPFTLHMRPTFDGVHVTLHDTSTTRPAPRPFRPGKGGGGIGWHLVHALCTQVSVVVRPDGKDVHAFLPW
ncbi:ATP-binding protein [Streptomyces sp. SAS_270]|uniref:ATP-binding protein n=1 Tax=Streptomyces sp. SAS_270 TaxID=3412748 RepID=UPI00403C356E